MDRAEQTYLKIIRWGIFISVFTPLILYPQFLSIFQFSKVIVFRSIVEIMLIFYVLLIISNPKYRPKWNALLITVTIFTGLYILTSITGVNPYRSFWGTLERMGGVFTFLHYWVFFVILISVFRDGKDPEGSLPQSAGFQPGAPGERSYGASWLKLLRLSVIAGFLSILFYLILTSKNPKIKKVSIALVILLIIIVSIFWLCKDQSWVQENPYLKRITDISLKTYTIQTRLWAWQSAWQGWKERFISGWGPENFNLLFAKYFDPRHYKGFGSEVVWDRAHNTFLNAGATMGIIGLLSYLSIFVVLAYYFIRAFRKKIVKKLTLGIFGAMLIAYIGHNMFIFDSFNSYLMFFIVIAYIGYLRRSTQIDSEQSSEHADIRRTDQRESAYSEGYNQRVSARRRTAAIILVPVVFFTIWKTAIIPAKANYAATRGIAYGRSGKHFSTAFDYFRKSLSFDAIQTEYEVRHHLARMVFRIFNKTDNPQEFGVGEEDIVFAIDEIKKNIETDSLDSIPYLYAARLNEFLSRLNQEKAEERLNKAENLLEKAKSLNEKNPYIYFELGQVRIFQNKFEQAIEFFDQGISIRPEVELGYWYKGAARFVNR